VLVLVLVLLDSSTGDAIVFAVAVAVAVAGVAISIGAAPVAYAGACKRKIRAPPIPGTEAHFVERRFVVVVVVVVGEIGLSPRACTEGETVEIVIHSGERLFPWDNSKGIACIGYVALAT